MSWGERSCLKPCRCQDKCRLDTCTVRCKQCVWDGKMEPDSLKSRVQR